MAFLQEYQNTFATDIDVGRKIRALSIFSFRSFLNMTMLLSDSNKARVLRQHMLDVVTTCHYTFSFTVAA